MDAIIRAGDHLAPLGPVLDNEDELPHPWIQGGVVSEELRVDALQPGEATDA